MTARGQRIFDPNSGGKKIPPAIQTDVERRVRKVAKEHFGASLFERVGPMTRKKRSETPEYQWEQALLDAYHICLWQCKLARVGETFL